MGKYYIGDIPYGDKELYHFGVKGMKWGVRRYQNEDGSLTPAGKERYRRHTKNASTGKRDVRDLNRLTGDALRKRQNGILKDMARLYEQYGEGIDKDTDDWATEIYIHFQKKIRAKSGDWYEGTSVSKGFSDGIDKLTKISQEYDDLEESLWSKSGYKMSYKELQSNSKLSALRQKFFDAKEDLLTQVLKDIDVEDNPDNRTAIGGILYDD